MDDLGICIVLYLYIYLCTYSHIPIYYIPWRPASVQCWKEFDFLVSLYNVSLMLYYFGWLLSNYITSTCLKPPVVVLIHTFNIIQQKWQQFSTGNSSNRCIGERTSKNIMITLFPMFFFHFQFKTMIIPTSLKSSGRKHMWRCPISHWDTPRSSDLFSDFLLLQTIQLLVNPRFGFGNL